MEKLLFTRVREIAELAKKLYEAGFKEYDFADLVVRLYNQDLLSEVPLKFRRSDHFLKTSDFRDHVYSQVVYAGLILSDTHKSQIKENNTIPDEKDIFTTVHLPYLLPKPHTHNFFEVVYVYDGSCTFFFDSEEKFLRTGDLCILAPESIHYVKTSKDSLVLSINIRQSTFDKTFWGLLENNNLLTHFFMQSLYNRHTTNYLTFSISDFAQFNPLVQEIFDESNITDSYSNNITISLVNFLFGKLLRNFGNTIHLYNDVSASMFDREFPLMLRYIQANYTTTTLSSLSEVFHYSTVHISRMFKKNLNETFSTVLQTLKLEHAQVFLRDTDYTLAEITEMVGYKSPDHLSRAFKKKYALTPSEYRKTFKQ